MTTNQNHLTAIVGRLFAGAILLSVSACVTSYEDQALRKVYRQHTESIVQSYTAGNAFEAGDAINRNRKVRQLIYLVDRNYEEWEKRLFDKKAGFDFIGTVSVIGINAVGTLTGGTQVKAILHAISGGIEGTKTAVDKDILQGQNTLAIITKMRELRSKKLTPLLEGMRTTSLEAYPMQQAMVDLGEYYNAGTFTVALQDIITTAGKEKEKSDQENKTAKTGKTITTTTKTESQP
jgi:hypothetical protein